MKTLACGYVVGQTDFSDCLLEFFFLNQTNLVIVQESQCAQVETLAMNTALYQRREQAPTLPYTLPSVKRLLSYAADAEGRGTDPPLQIHWE